MSSLFVSLLGLLPLQMPAASSSASKQAIAPDASKLRDRIVREGAGAVMKSLFDVEHSRSDAWDAVTDKIAGGTREWLDIAQLLLPASDGILAETLYAALSEALPKAPETVLAVTEDVTSSAPMA